MPEEWLILQTLFVAPVAKDVVYKGGSVGWRDTSGYLDLMGLHAFCAACTNRIIATLEAHVVVAIVVA